ncbi:MAG: hypothetical protein P1P77_10710 [Spirochaetaceae bacterium]|nr:hypothetical protein [Spirochaetaceae bacterium]
MTRTKFDDFTEIHPDTAVMFTGVSPRIYIILREFYRQRFCDNRGHTDPENAVVQPALPRHRFQWSGSSGIGWNHFP